VFRVKTWSQCSVHHKFYMHYLGMVPEPSMGEANNQLIKLFYAFCTVHCDIITQHKTRKCTFRKTAAYAVMVRYVLHVLV
jgi:hypothetical protein